MMLIVHQVLRLFTIRRASKCVIIYRKNAASIVWIAKLDCMTIQLLILHHIF